MVVHYAGIACDIDGHPRGARRPARRRADRGQRPRPLRPLARPAARQPRPVRDAELPRDQELRLRRGRRAAPQRGRATSTGPGCSTTRAPTGGRSSSARSTSTPGRTPARRSGSPTCSPPTCSPSSSSARSIQAKRPRGPRALHRGCSRRTPSELGVRRCRSVPADCELGVPHVLRAAARPRAPRRGARARCASAGVHADLPLRAAAQLGRRPDVRGAARPSARSPTTSAAGCCGCPSTTTSAPTTSTAWSTTFLAVGVRVGDGLTVAASSRTAGLLVAATSPTTGGTAPAPSCCTRSSAPYLGHARRGRSTSAARTARASAGCSGGHRAGHARPVPPRAHSRARACAAPPTALPFADETFDVVGAFDVVEHCEREALARGRAGPGAGAGRPDAAVGAGLPVGLVRPRRPAGHHRRYTRPRLVRLVEGAGLRGRPGDVRLRRGVPVLRRRAAAPPARAAAAGDRRRPAHRGARPGQTGCSLRLSAAEQRVLRRRDLPFGSSVFLAATKPGA